MWVWKLAKLLVVKNFKFWFSDFLSNGCDKAITKVACILNLSNIEKNAIVDIRTYILCVQNWVKQMKNVFWGRELVPISPEVKREHLGVPYHILFATFCLCGTHRQELAIAQILLACFLCNKLTEAVKVVERIIIAAYSKQISSIVTFRQLYFNFLIMLILIF